MKKVYLKGYYAYKNLGDELLLIGVLHYLQDVWSVQHVQVEVKDLDRAQQRHERNKTHFPQEITIQRVPLPQGLAKLGHMIRSLLGIFPYLVLGGGEVIHTAAPFPHDGRNYLAMYWPLMLRRQYAVIGGIATRGPQDTLARMLLSRAEHIVVRESGSYDQASQRSDQVVLHEDFAKRVIEHSKQHLEPMPPKDDYLLINIHPSKVNDESRKSVEAFLAKHQDTKVLFVPCDMVHDMSFFAEVQRRFPSWELYERTQYSIDEIVRLFIGARAAWGMRLHFLLLCHELKVPYEMIVYHDKVNKVLGL